MIRSRWAAIRAAYGRRDSTMTEQQQPQQPDEQPDEVQDDETVPDPRAVDVEQDNERDVDVEADDVGTVNVGGVHVTRNEAEQDDDAAE